MREGETAARSPSAPTTRAGPFLRTTENPLRRGLSPRTPGGPATQEAAATQAAARQAPPPRQPPGQPFQYADYRSVGEVIASCTLASPGSVDRDEGEIGASLKAYEKPTSLKHLCPSTQLLKWSHDLSVVLRLHFNATLGRSTLRRQETINVALSHHRTSIWLWAIGKTLSLSLLL